MPRPMLNSAKIVAGADFNGPSVKQLYIMNDDVGKLELSVNVL